MIIIMLELTVRFDFAHMLGIQSFIRPLANPRYA
jgi:hypothetical protein